MECFLKKGFYTIGALKTNRIIYPCEIRIQAGQFVTYLKKQDANVNLVTVDHRQFYVYRYEGKLNDIENAVVILSYPKEVFLNPKAIRVFISTDASLSTQEILDMYVSRWPIEVFFRESKRKLALDKYQIRTSTGTQSYWLIMSFVHFMCCTCKENSNSFEIGYQYLKQTIKNEKITKLYTLILEGMLLKDILQLVG